MARKRCRGEAGRDGSSRGPHLKAGAQPCWSSSRAEPSISLMVAACARSAPRQRRARSGCAHTSSPMHAARRITNASPLPVHEVWSAANSRSSGAEARAAGKGSGHPCHLPPAARGCPAGPAHLQHGIHSQVRQPQLHAHTAVGAREADLGRWGRDGQAGERVRSSRGWAARSCASRLVVAACRCQQQDNILPSDQPWLGCPTSICCCCSRRVSASAWSVGRLARSGWEGSHTHSRWPASPAGKER